MTIDPRLDPSIPEITQPQLYFGENLTSYSIVGTKRDEVDYLDSSGATVPYRYQGSGGVQLSSWVRQAAFFLRFNFEWNLLFSDYITPQSRILYIRDVRERFETAAPFLKFDADPYPVIVNGRIVYMIDGYTTSDRYPNAQRADTSGLDTDSGLAGHRFDYIRNSVKGVLDAYDGTVKLYIVDPNDPIVQAYAKAFPDLFDDVEPARSAARASTTAIPKTSSGFRRTCGARTTSPIRRASTKARTAGQWRRIPERASPRGPALRRPRRRRPRGRPFVRRLSASTPCT